MREAGREPERRACSIASMRTGLKPKVNWRLKPEKGFGVGQRYCMGLNQAVSVQLDALTLVRFTVEQRQILGPARKSVRLAAGH